MRTPIAGQSRSTPWPATIANFQTALRAELRRLEGGALTDADEQLNENSPHGADGRFSGGEGGGTSDKAGTAGASSKSVNIQKTWTPAIANGLRDAGFKVEARGGDPKYSENSYKAAQHFQMLRTMQTMQISRADGKPMSSDDKRTATDIVHGHGDPDHVAKLVKVDDHEYHTKIGTVPVKVYRQIITSNPRTGAASHATTWIAERTDVSGKRSLLSDGNGSRKQAVENAVEALRFHRSLKD